MASTRINQKTSKRKQLNSRWLEDARSNWPSCGEGTNVVDLKLIAGFPSRETRRGQAAGSALPTKVPGECSTSSQPHEGAMHGKCVRWCVCQRVFTLTLTDFELTYDTVHFLPRGILSLNFKNIGHSRALYSLIGQPKICRRKPLGHRAAVCTSPEF